MYIIFYGRNAVISFIDYLLRLDGEILLWIQNNLRTDLLNDIFIFLTSLGNGGRIWIVLSLILLIPKKTRKVGAICALSLIFSLLFNNMMLKKLIDRTRPFVTLDGLNNLVSVSDSSFPSGHTSSSFSAAVVMLRNLPKKFGIPAFILAVIIAFSRLYIGVHYPSDVIGGIITGTLCSVLAQFLINKAIELYSKKKSDSAN